MEYNDSPTIQVKCDVKNCDYNKSRMCYADSLKVEAKGDGKAATCDGTCCSTFKTSKETNKTIY